MVVEQLLPLLQSSLFWMGAIVTLLFTGIGSLLFFKWRKLNFKAFEILELGDGKLDIKITRAGWFREKTMFLKLIDYGKRWVMRTKDGRKVIGFTNEDFHYSKGKKVLILTSDPMDRNILVPIKSFEIKNGNLFSLLPPMELQDAAVENFSQATKEMKPFGEVVVQLIIVGLIIVGGLLAIVFVTRFAQSMIADASKIAVENSAVCAEVCSDAVVKGVEKIISTQDVVAP